MFSPREIASWSSLSIYQATDREQCFTVEKKFRWPPNTCEVWKWSNSVEDIKAVGSNLS